MGYSKIFICNFGTCKENEVFPKRAEITFLRLNPAYTNNKINSEKNHETCTWFSAVIGGQQLLELTTFLSDTQILF